MKFDKIVAFGDSFVWGDELLDPALIDHPHAHPVLIENTLYRESHCFLGQLGQHYGVPTENFGWPGGSQQSTIWTYLWWIEHEVLPVDRCVVLVGLTDGNRHSFYNPRHVSYSNDPVWNKFMHTSWIHSGASTVDKDWADMGKRFMLLTDCEELNHLNYMQSTYFFQGQSTRHAALFQFYTIATGESIQQPSLLWPQNSLQSWFTNDSDREKYLCDMGHPNEQGHALIARRLISEIDRAILVE